MKHYIHLFDTNTKHENFYTRSNKKYLDPYVDYCLENRKVSYSLPFTYKDRYLTFEALEDCTFSIFFDKHEYITLISYSINNGKTWYTTNTYGPITTPIIEKGKTIIWKGIATTYTLYSSQHTFSSTGQYNVYGNILSLIYDDDFINNTELPSQKAAYTFKSLFKNSKNLHSAKYLQLPNNVKIGCYQDMFYGCTGLTEVPTLPATTLALSCYSYMFYGCTSLTETPELPATTLQSYCYQYMFSGCTSLTIAPELPATTLAEYCYLGMFYNCTNLNYIKALFTTTPSTSYTSNWVYGVASSGTFVKNSSAAWNVTGKNGIPSGWTVQTASA